MKSPTDEIATHTDGTFNSETALNWGVYIALNELLDRLTASSHESDFRNVDSLSDYSQMTVVRKSNKKQAIIQFDAVGPYLTINHWCGKELATQLLLVMEGDRQGKGLKTNVRTFESRPFTFNTPLRMMDLMTILRTLEPEEGSTIWELTTDIHNEIFKTFNKGESNE